jgi:hypothetical protein
VNQGDSKYLYARIRATGPGTASSCRPPAGGWPAGEAALDKSREFSLEGWVWGIQKFAARDDDDIEPRRGFVASEQFAGQTLGAITDHGAADFACRRDAETRMLAGIPPDEHRHQPTVQLDTLLVGQLEVGSPPDVFRRPERRHLRLAFV